MLEVDASGGTFRFNSVDLYSSVTRIPYTITGFRNDLPVFTMTGTDPNTFGNFKTAANPHYSTVVDAVIIGLTNTPGSCSNPMGVDNISATQAGFSAMA